MIERQNVNNDYITDTLMLIILGAFLLYEFFFQYAIAVVDNALSILSIIMIFIIFFKLLSNVHIDIKYLFLLLYYIIVLFSGIFFSEDINQSLSLVVRLVKYSIPMLFISLYIGSDLKKMMNFCTLYSGSVFLLSLALIIFGKFNDTNSLVINNLNANVYSTFVFLSLFTNLFILQNIKIKFIKLSLMLVIIFEFYTQILANSRRGVIVYLFVCLIYLIVSIITSPRFKVLYGATFIGFLILGIVLVITNIDYLTAKYTVIDQLVNGNIYGDHLRLEYQTIALEIFKESPFIGKGLGAVQIRCGMYSHSFYHEILATSGIFGFCSILIPIIFVGFYVFYLNIKINNIMIKKQMFLIDTFIIALLITGITVVLIYDLIFYIILAVILSYYNIIRDMIKNSL